MATRPSALLLREGAAAAQSRRHWPRCAASHRAASEPAARALSLTLDPLLPAKCTPALAPLTSAQHPQSQFRPGPSGKEAFFAGQGPQDSFAHQPDGAPPAQHSGSWTPGHSGGGQSLQWSSEAGAGPSLSPQPWVGKGAPGPQSGTGTWAPGGMGPPPQWGGQGAAKGKPWAANGEPGPPRPEGCGAVYCAGCAPDGYEGGREGGCRSQSFHAAVFFPQ